MGTVFRPQECVWLILLTLRLQDAGYSTRQIADAEAARKTMSIMGLPSLQTFKLMVRENLVNNCLVMSEAIRVADDVFGPDVASFQGKMTHRTPKRSGGD